MRPHAVIINSMKDALTKPEISFFLSIAIPLIALAVSWGVMTTRIDHIEKLALGLQETYKEQASMNEGIKIQLAEIQKDVLYIRKELDKHSNE